MKNEKITDKLHKKLKSFIEHPVVGMSILGLIIISVGLLIYEFAYPQSPEDMELLNQINDLIIYIFIIELFIRFYISKNFKTFISECWIDILAVLPLLRVFRLGRAFRIVRIFRLLSFGAHMNRHMKVFTMLFKKRSLEYFLILIFSLFVIIFGAIGLVSFEKSYDLPKAIWTTLFTILAGEFINDFPGTFAGKIMALTIMFFGMTFFAMITGTVSALMIEKFRMGSNKAMDFQDFKDHIIICGINNKLKIIIKEFQMNEDYAKTPIIIISKNLDENDFEEELMRTEINCSRIFLFNGDFTKIDVLEKVNIFTASCAIILADNQGTGSDYDVDARTVLAALTIERLHPEIYSCAELIHREYEDHLKMGGVNDIIVTEDFGGNVLAHATINKGLTRFFDELLTAKYGNEVYRVKSPDIIKKLEFKKASSLLLEKYSVILVGIVRDNDFKINPQNIDIEENDEILVISRGKPVLG